VRVLARRAAGQGTLAVAGNHDGTAIGYYLDANAVDLG